jgi:hypothetical protein
MATITAVTTGAGGMAVVRSDQRVYVYNPDPLEAANGWVRLPDPPVQPAAISGDAVRTVIVAGSGEAYEYVRDPTRTTAWTALPSIPTT